MGRVKGKPNRPVGPCETAGCSGQRRRRDMQVCSECAARRRWQRGNLRRGLGNEARLDLLTREEEERNLDLMVEARLDTIDMMERMPYVDTTPPPRISDGVSNFWYLWWKNPDNPCTHEILDALGWD